MEKPNIIKLFFIYLKSNLKILFAVLSIFFILLFMFYLYSLPLMPVIYSLFISIIPLSVVTALDFAKYRKKVEGIYFLLKNMESYANDFSAGDNYNDKLITEAINALGKKLAVLRDNELRMKDEFSDYYTMWVHQIKTPIAAANLLLRQDSDNKSALKQELFKIEKYADMALGFIRIESMTSDFNFARYLVHDIVKEAIKKHSTVFIYKRLGANLKDFDNQVVTDRKWLLFAIEQILSNSLKYTSSGFIDFYMDKNDILYIKDSGIGINPEDLPRIFDRGFTGHNGRIDKKSSGLGLYLCKKTLDKLGHKIRVFSNAETGTLVKIYLGRTENIAYD